MESRAVTAGLNGLMILVGWRWASRLNAAQTNVAGVASKDAARLTLDITGRGPRRGFARSAGAARPRRLAIRARLAERHPRGAPPREARKA